MVGQEFYATANYSEDSLSELYDVRPFGNRQGEAVDFFLQELDADVRDARRSTAKQIIVLRDRRLVVMTTSMPRIKHLKAVGVPLNFKEEDNL